MKGFSTIELLFAFALATIFLSGAVLIAFGAQTSSLDASLTNGSLYHVSTLLHDVVASTTKNWNGTVKPWQTDFYTQGTSVQSIAPCLKHIIATSTWTTEKNRGQIVSFETFLGSTSTAHAQGGGCDPFPPTVWDTPSSRGSVDVASSDGTDIAVRTINGKSYAFVTTFSDTPSGKDLVVINAEDADNPSEEGVSVTAFNGLNGIAIGNSYAYVLNNNNVEQLLVIDISDPTNITEVPSARKTLPYIVYTCSPITDPCISGRSIAYYNGRIYIGTSYLAFNFPWNNEFHVYCVDDNTVLGCSPTTPVWLGSYNVNRNVNDIALATQVVGGVEKTIAYLAVSGSDVGAPEMRVLDVTNPVTISEIGSFNPSGTLYGRSIAILGDNAYLGRDRATGANKDFYILDIKNPLAPIELSSRLLGIASGNYVSSINVQGERAFVTTTDSAKPLFVFDVGNSTNPTPTSICNFPIAQKTTASVYHHNLLFMVNKTNDLFRILYDSPSICI